MEGAGVLRRRISETPSGDSHRKFLRENVSFANARAEVNFRRASPELWRTTLSRIPTLFGRLVFLSSLRDTKTGAYYHDSLAHLAQEDADRTLRSSHQQIFQSWISSGLADQMADLETYLNTAGGPRYAIPYRNLVPSEARDVEQQLYLTDLETLLELLRFDPNGACRTQEA